jgi:hypothetical protein
MMKKITKSSQVFIGMKTLFNHLEGQTLRQKAVPFSKLVQTMGTPELIEDYHHAYFLELRYNTIRNLLVLKRRLQ